MCTNLDEKQYLELGNVQYIFLLVKQTNMNSLSKILANNAPILANTPYIKLYIKLCYNKIAMLYI